MDINKKGKAKERILVTLTIVLATTIFLILYSTASSVILNTYGGDSDIFVMLGKLTKGGMIPYKEFFDHKGPFIILVEYMACLVPNYKVGVFILELIFLSISLIAVYCICKLYFSTKKSVIISVISLFILNVYYEGGNLTEEYCLPFLMWSAYFFVRYVNRQDKSVVTHNKWFAFFYGITFAVCALTRITNAMPLCAMVFVIAVYMLFQKQYMEILKNALALILGIIVMVLPFALYFIKNGALDEVIYATFTYNFRYAESQVGAGLTITQRIKMLVYLVPVIMSFFVAVFKGKIFKEKKLTAISIALMSILAIALQMNGQDYRHYLMIWMPLLIMTICILDVKNIKNILFRWIVIASLVGTVLIVGEKNVMLLRDSYNYCQQNREKSYNKSINQVLNEITKQKRSKVLAYNIPAKFYISADLKPCYKYCILQDWQCAHDKDMEQEFETMLKSLKAEYIVIPANAQNKHDEFLQEHYHVKYKNGEFQLLEINI